MTDQPKVRMAVHLPCFNDEEEDRRFDLHATALANRMIKAVDEYLAEGEAAGWPDGQPHTICLGASYALGAMMSADAVGDDFRSGQVIEGVIGTLLMNHLNKVIAMLNAGAGSPKDEANDPSSDNPPTKMRFN